MNIHRYRYVFITSNFTLSKSIKQWEKKNFLFFYSFLFNTQAYVKNSFVVHSHTHDAGKKILCLKQENFIRIAMPVYIRDFVLRLFLNFRPYYTFFLFLFFLAPHLKMNWIECLTNNYCWCTCWFKVSFISRYRPFLFPYHHHHHPYSKITYIVFVCGIFFNETWSGSRSIHHHFFKWLYFWTD